MIEDNSRSSMEIPFKFSIHCEFNGIIQQNIVYMISHTRKMITNTCQGSYLVLRLRIMPTIMNLEYHTDTKWTTNGKLTPALNQSDSNRTQTAGKKITPKLHICSKKKLIVTFINIIFPKHWIGLAIQSHWCYLYTLANAYSYGSINIAPFAGGNRDFNGEIEMLCEQWKYDRFIITIFASFVFVGPNSRCGDKALCAAVANMLRYCTRTMRRFVCDR